MFRKAVVATLCVVVLLASGIGSAAASTGIDVASYQHPNGAPINWGEVRGAGHSFAYVKATEATNYTNPYFAGDWAGIAGAGLLRGAYHYARPQMPYSTAVDQARYFVSRTGTMQSGRDLPPMFDLEETGGLSPSQLVQWSLTWLGEVERLTGRRPVIYTGYYFWKDALGSTTALRDHRLWLPQYNGLGAPNLVPSEWGSWTFWQSSSTGRVPGIIGNVDMNTYCCSDANLEALAGSGANPAAGNPFGSLDSVSKASGRLRINGWGIDPDVTAPIKVHVYANGQMQGEFTANATRTDVGSAYPGWGSSHGYSIDIPAPVGNQQVCVYAINVRTGTTNPTLGCRQVTGNPAGTVDSVREVPNGLRVEGWAFDPDLATPDEVHVYVNGVGRAITADRSRPDVQSAYGLTSPNAGFQVDVPANEGANEVCVWAINKPSGPNTHLGCRTVSFTHEPFGSFDAGVGVSGGVSVRGWALDPDSTGAVAVHVYVDGEFSRALTASTSRPDVGAAHPGMGANHGFDGVVPVDTPGAHQVCIYGLNLGAGSANPLIACRTVVVPVSDPFGSLDQVTRSGGTVTVRGWAVDRDTTSPLTVHVYANGVFVGALTADTSRPDVGAAFPGVGSNRGFDGSLAVPAGPVRVCVYALNVGPGTNNSTMGCKAA